MKLLDYHSGLCIATAALLEVTIFYEVIYIEHFVLDLLNSKLKL